MTSEAGYQTRRAHGEKERSPWLPATRSIRSLDSLFCSIALLSMNFAELKSGTPFPSKSCSMSTSRRRSAER